MVHCMLSVLIKNRFDEANLMSTNVKIRSF